MVRSPSMTTTSEVLRPITPSALPQEGVFERAGLGVENGELHPRVGDVDAHRIRRRRRLPGQDRLVPKPSATGSERDITTVRLVIVAGE